MTFGQTLRQLLSVSGVKLTHLANGLGYDSSYVSRWINDIKSPSLKNNSELFFKISETIINCCTENGLEQLREQYCPDGEDLYSALAQRLQDAYKNPGQEELFATYIERNASYFPGGSRSKFGFKNFRDAFSAAAKASGRDMVECICNVRLSVSGNKPVDFFPSVSPDVGAKDRFRIMIHQLIDMDDFENNVDPCCAAICTFTRYNRDVLYTFYEYDRQQEEQPFFENYMLIESSMMQFSFINPLTKRSDTIISFDTAVNSNDFLFFKSKLAFMPKVLKFYSREDVKKNYQFLYNYVMDGNIRFFLDYMQPIYMSSDLFEKIGVKYFPGFDPSGFMFQYHRLCANTTKEIILYSSAFLNYICDGGIFIFGQKIILDIYERIEHLEQIIENAEAEKCRITILSDMNPLLNREDTKLSFFLSSKSGFLVAVGDSETPIIRFRSVRTIDHFNEFFTHILNLGSDYLISGQQSLDFIKRGLDILKNSI